MITLKKFKEKIISELSKREFVDEKLYEEYRNLERELGSLINHPDYKPKTKITFQGFKKSCHVCSTFLETIIVYRTLGSFGLFERRILNCSSCGYKYPDYGHV